MQWNLSNFLPASVREPFAAAVAGFLSAAYKQPNELPALMRGEISQKLFQYVFDLMFCSYFTKKKCLLTGNRNVGDSKTCSPNPYPPLPLIP